MQTIPIPSSLTPTTLIPFSKYLENVENDSLYCLDFAKLGTVEPFGMLFLAALIRQFDRTRQEIQGKTFKIHARNYKGNDYASWMGFFKSFGLKHGNAPGEAPGSDTYIPLTRLRVDKIQEEASEAFIHHGEIIEEKSTRIASILIRNDDGEVTETLIYAIREIMRNVVEHGNAQHIWYAAQYWPSKNKVEISILDEGIGLRASLGRNKN